jgi:arsenical pump membrane protein
MVGRRARFLRVTLRSRLQAVAVACASAAAIIAAVLAPAHTASATAQAWPAFVLVAGLLVIGALAADEGLFAAAGARISRLPGSGVRLLVALLAFEALVTAVLNLDTAVVFLTPVVIHAARHRGLDEEPFLYGAVFVANSASLLLPGSNLTNLIVLTHERVAGHVFAERMLPAWIAAVLGTIAVLGLVYRRRLAFERPLALEARRLRPGPGTLGVGIAAVLVLVLQRPAVPVLIAALVLAALSRASGRSLIAAANPALLVGVFAVAISLGALARSIDGVADLGESLSRWATTGVAAGLALAINNLPAAVVLSAHAPAHPRAMLIGLDLGPNLAVTGSLSAILWLQVARRAGSHPSVTRYTRLGAVVVPVTIGLALAALRLFIPPSF